MSAQALMRRSVLATALTCALAAFDTPTARGADAATTPQPPRDAPPTIAAPELPMAAMDSMDMPPMQGGRPPPDARDPDYSDGQTMSMLPGMADSMNDDSRFGKLLVDQLEAVRGGGTHGWALDAQGYYGGDVDKAWFKIDGERSDGRLRDTRAEALWSHAALAFWDTQLGVRHDVGDGPGRSWAALGVQGLAPYWFDIEATAYVGSSGRTAARFEAQYDVLLTQRWIATADFEVNAYGRSDPARRIGAGLSNTELGLRMRYELTRQFAPYLGFDWNRRNGRTADLARANGEAAFEHLWVAGVRFWF